MKAIAYLIAALLTFYGVPDALTEYSGGADCVIMLEPDVRDMASVTDDDMDSYLAAARARLDDMGYYDADIVKTGKRIAIGISKDADTGAIAEALCKKPRLTFRDSDMNVVMEGTGNVSSAKARFGPLGGDLGSEHYVALYFTSSGQEAFRIATRNAAAMESGKNVIAIMIDDTLISYPSVSQEINEDSCVIHGSFTKESAKELADLINTSLLSFDLKVAGNEKSTDTGIKSVIMLEPDVTDLRSVTDKDMDTTLGAVCARLDDMGYYNADVQRAGNRITVTLFGDIDTTKVTEALCKKPRFTFRDADMNIVMEGTGEYITSARADFGQLDRYSADENYVTISFTKDGQEAFKKVTENILMRPADENVITIMIDDKVLSSPAVYSVIDSDSCIINGSDFTKYRAKNLADLINASLLPFDLKEVRESGNGSE